jgi:glycosyltransferase involved in cell wall biosynthesis
VLDLLAHKNRRRALGAEGRLHVVRTFSWDRAADQFADILTKQPVEAAA